MNTTYSDKLKPQFQSVGVQPTKIDLSAEKGALDFAAAKLKQEQQTLQNIAQDQAQIEFNRASAELIKQYDTDYVGLGNALKELQDENYTKYAEKDPELATILYRQQDIVRLRAVDDAHNNFIKKNNDLAKQNAQLMLDSIEASAPDDYASFLTESEQPSETVDTDNAVERWNNNISERNKILNRKDLDGNDIFTEKQRQSGLDVSKTQIEGFKRFFDNKINNDNINLEDSNAYYNDMIRTPEDYMNAKQMDRATYDKVKSYAKSRLTEAQKEASVRKAASLFTADDKSDIEIAKQNNLLSEKTINKIIKATEKAGKKAYNPNVVSKPTTFLESMRMLKELADMNDDYTFTGRSAVIDAAADAMEKFNDWAETANPTDEVRNQVKQSISQLIVDSNFGDLIRKELWYPVDLFGQGSIKEEDEKILFSFDLGQRSSNAKKRAQAKDMALGNANKAMQEVVYRYSIGDIEKARELQNQARLNYVKDRNSYWIREQDFDRLLQQRAEGKKPIVCRDGVICEFDGISDDKMILTIKQ